jgi:hypothetical protein
VIRSDSASSLTKEGGSAEWTNALQNLLLELGIELGFHVFPRRRYFSRGKLGSNSTHDRPERGDDIGEYILDVSWTRYPRTIEWLESLRAPVGAALEPGLVLACEGEWAAGRFGKLEREEHVAAVLDDFAKLTDVRAARKVLIFALQAGRGSNNARGAVPPPRMAVRCGLGAKAHVPLQHDILIGRDEIKIRIAVGSGSPWSRGHVVHGRR